MQFNFDELSATFSQFRNAERVWAEGTRCVPRLPRSRDVAVHLQMYEWAGECLREQSVRSVVDYGCGAGYGAEVLHQLIPDLIYVGADSDKLCVTYANDTYGQHGSFYCVDLFEYTAEPPMAGVCIDTLHLLNAPLWETLPRLLEHSPLLYFSVPYDARIGRHQRLTRETFTGLETEFRLRCVLMTERGRLTQSPAEASWIVGEIYDPGEYHNSHPRKPGVATALSG
jgi:SAM-dependent methyltransferase